MATIKQALQTAIVLKDVSESWKLDAELLLADAIGKPREYLFTWPDEALSESQLKKFDESCERRSTNEPVAYILGRQAFWDFELVVSPAVLIPRPETELLVENAIEILRQLPQDNVVALDLGTGSGAIALALAAEDSRWQISAVDSSEAALAVARGNASSLQLANIEFILTSWCDGLEPNCYDLIAANPPYVEEGDKHLLEGSLPFEPIAALVADEQGLADIRTIVDQARACLKDGGWLLIEHGYNQREAVMKILSDAAYQEIECSKDLSGVDRMTRARFRK